MKLSKNMTMIFIPCMQTVCHKETNHTRPHREDITELLKYINLSKAVT